MNREEIDVILSESFLYHKPVSIQLNTKDEFGRLLDPIEGLFVGEAYEDYLSSTISKYFGRTSVILK